jgi:hypothetical protein
METKPGYRKYRIRDLEDFKKKTGIGTKGKYVWIKDTERPGDPGRGLRDCYITEFSGYGFDSDWFKEYDLFSDVAEKLDLI